MMTAFKSEYRVSHKKLKKDAVMKGEQHEHVKRERAILAMIAHPFVVTLAAAALAGRGRHAPAAHRYPAT